MSNARAGPQAAPEFVYRIDYADNIIDVDENWLAFARANGAPDLDRARVEQTSIWQFIVDTDTRLIYRMLFDAVRTRMQPLTVTFRCDSPSLRRFMSLTCTLGKDLSITLRSRLLRQERRPYVAVLDDVHARSEAVVVLCAWCKRCEVADMEWVEIEQAIPRLDAFDQDEPPMVSHGMCPDCHLEKLKEIRARGVDLHQASSIESDDVVKR